MKFAELMYNIVPRLKIHICGGMVMFGRAREKVWKERNRPGTVKLPFGVKLEGKSF